MHLRFYDQADLRLSDICNLLGRDWIPLAQCLEIPDSDLNLIDNEYPDNTTQQAMVMLKLWMAQSQNKVTGKIPPPPSLLSVDICPFSAPLDHSS